MTLNPEAGSKQSRIIVAATDQLDADW